MPHQLRCLVPDLLRSNNPVLLSFAEALLREAGIGYYVADTNMSIVEGSIGAFPRRLQVLAPDWAAARRLLIDAGLEHELVVDDLPDLDKPEA